MTGTTAGGWPYLVPDDHPLEYPAQSQQLAALFDKAAPFKGSGLAVRNTDQSVNNNTAYQAVFEEFTTTLDADRHTPLDVASAGILTHAAGLWLVQVSCVWETTTGSSTGGYIRWTADGTLIQTFLLAFAPGLNNITPMFGMGPLPAGTRIGAQFEPTGGNGLLNQIVVAAVGPV